MPLFGITSPIMQNLITWCHRLLACCHSGEAVYIVWLHVSQATQAYSTARQPAKQPAAVAAAADNDDACFWDKPASVGPPAKAQQPLQPNAMLTPQPAEQVGLNVCRCVHPLCRLCYKSLLHVHSCRRSTAFSLSSCRTGYFASTQVVLYSKLADVLQSHTLGSIVYQQCFSLAGLLFSSPSICIASIFLAGNPSHTQQ